MKRIALALCILAQAIGNASWVLADDSLNDEKLSTAYTILGGVIKSVSWADPAKGTKSEIVVVNASKKPVHILVTSTTTLWDNDEKAIMPDSIVARSHANVIYFTTPEGINLAKSIKILK